MCDWVQHLLSFSLTFLYGVPRKSWNITYLSNEIFCCNVADDDGDVDVNDDDEGSDKIITEVVSIIIDTI